MNVLFRDRATPAAFLAVLGIALAGCRRDGEGGFERYVPPEEAARAGVTLALEGWLKGLSPADSGRADPEVRVVDQTRRADRRLAGYEILGESPAVHAREFVVRVRYEGEWEPEVVRFVAVGVDPTWVFRREDYDSIWSHREEAPADRVGEPADEP